MMTATQKDDTGLTRGLLRVLNRQVCFLLCIVFYSMTQEVMVFISFLADRTIGRAYATVSRLSVVCPSVRRL